MTTRRSPRTSNAQAGKKRATPAKRKGTPENGTSTGGLTIAELAHRLYLERGGEHGRDVDDWLEAERRIRGV